jgi:hypothetical protein
MKAVTEVGAPWYTSGVHAWNGAAPTLNRRPTATRPIPASSRTSEPLLPEIAMSISANRTLPANP